MKRNSLLIVSGVWIGLISVLALMFYVARPNKELPDLTTVYIRYAFLLKNESREPLLNSTFSVFGPVSDAQSQTIREFTANTPMDIAKDAAGNLSFVAAGLDIPPFGSKNISLTVAVDLRAHSTSDRLKNREAFLKHEAYLDMTSPAVIAAARRFEDMNPNDIPFAIYHFLVQNVETVGYIAQARGADYALRQGKGDCTEFMHAFIAIARLNGIPARAVGGFVVENDATLVRSHEYHNWAEFYQDGRWIVADAQKRVFDELGSRKYIAFRYLEQNESGEGNRTRQYSQRFLTFDSRLSVQMM